MSDAIQDLWVVMCRTNEAHFDQCGRAVGDYDQANTEQWARTIDEEGWKCGPHRAIRLVDAARVQELEARNAVLEEVLVVAKSVLIVIPHVAMDVGIYDAISAAVQQAGNASGGKAEQAKKEAQNG